jgi:polyisoprenoid-binding protein YceI
VPGEFRDYDGSFSFDPDKPLASKVSVVIQAASINTANDMRDKHLQSPDFFDVNKFPTLEFVSKKILKGDGDNQYKVVGDLTIHGVTKSVTLDATYLGKDTLMGAKIIGFSAATKIDRRDFGLTWSKILESGNLMVGNDVAITLDIAGMDKAGMEKMKKMSEAKPAPTPQK